MSDKKREYKIDVRDIYNYVANGGDCSLILLEEESYFNAFLSHKKIEELIFPNGSRVIRSNVSPEHKKPAEERRQKKIKELPQHEINKAAEAGYDLRYLTEEQIRAIPQRSVNKRAAAGLELKDFTEDQIRAIPREIFMLYVFQCGGCEKCLTEEQFKDVPEAIKQPTAEGLNALILFGAGEIGLRDLPLDVFVNYELRASLLRTIRNKINKQHGGNIEKDDFDYREIIEELKRAVAQKINNDPYENGRE